MSNVAKREPLTYEEYLAFERSAATKHEFANGEIFAMAGGKRAHNLVAMTLGRILGNALAGRRCQVLSSDMRVRTGDGVACYPDVSVACPPLRFTDETEDELRNPTVVVEVLSDSTEAYDRGDKLVHYQTIEGLREIVLVSTKRARVDHYSLRDDGSWVLRSYVPGQSMPLPSLAIEVPIDAIYENVFESTG